MHLHEALVDSWADVTELGQHSMLDDVNNDLSAKDVCTSPQQLRAGARHPTVVHLFHSHKYHCEQQMKALCDVLPDQDEQFGWIKSLEYSPCRFTEASVVG